MIEVFQSSDLPNSVVENSLIWGDNIEALKWLPAKNVQVAYLDPPFLSQRDFSTGKVKVFSDRWGKSEKDYYSYLTEVLTLCHSKLQDEGALFLHCDYRTTAKSRLIAEEIFGSDNYINELIWHYKTGGASLKLGFSKKHDTIHFFAKDRKRCKWFPQKEKSYLTHKYGFSNVKIEQDEKGPYTYVNSRDVFELPALRGNQPERVPFPTQKPIALIEKLLLSTSEPGDIVLDPFSGSGTTAVCANNLSRKWISIDKNYYSIATLKGRLENTSYSEIELSEPGPDSGSLSNVHSWSVLKKSTKNYYEVEFGNDEPSSSCIRTIPTEDKSYLLTLNDFNGNRTRQCLKSWQP